MLFYILSFLLICGNAIAFSATNSRWLTTRMTRTAGLEMALKVGDVPPDFELPDKDGKIVKLSQFRGKKILCDFLLPE